MVKVANTIQSCLLLLLVLLLVLLLLFAKVVATGCTAVPYRACGSYNIKRSSVSGICSTTEREKRSVFLNRVHRPSQYVESIENRSDIP